MAQQTLQEMDDKTFLAKMDVLLEALERQTEGDPLGDWTVQSVKGEIRRRLLERQAVVTETTPAMVEVEKLNISGLIPPHANAADFHGAPCRISVTGIDSVEHTMPMTVSHGFFTGDEADAFLLGLETARKFGFPFTYIPNADDDAV